MPPHDSNSIPKSRPTSLVNANGRSIDTEALSFDFECIETCVPYSSRVVPILSAGSTKLTILSGAGEVLRPDGRVDETLGDNYVVTRSNVDGRIRSSGQSGRVVFSQPREGS